MYVGYRTSGLGGTGAPPAGQIAYRRHLAGVGLDAAGSVLDSGTRHTHPTLRRYLGDGLAAVAWTASPGSGTGTDVEAQTFGTSRPFVYGVVADPVAFAPLAGQSTSVAYRLGDGQWNTLAVTARVHDAAGALVRALLEGVSQSTGAQSVAWDGTNGAGVVQPAGPYTVRLSATDAEGLRAPEQAAAVALRSQAIGYTG